MELQQDIVRRAVATYRMDIYWKGKLLVTVNNITQENAKENPIDSVRIFYGVARRDREGTR